MANAAPERNHVKPGDGELKRRIADVGRGLAAGISSVLDALPFGTHGPAALARTIGVDKILAGRVLSAARKADPIAVLYAAPGPDPLRRLLRAARKQGVAADILVAAERAVERFEALIRQEAGDRSALDAMISAWLPEARAEFELRRKQTVFRGMSQLVGVAADKHVTTIMFNLSADEEHLDVMCLFAMLGLHRLRDGCTVKFSSRRLTQGEPPRLPCTLDGEAVEGVQGLLLEDYCSRPAPRINVDHAGDVVHYTLAGNEFGPRSATDLVFAEVNRGEMPHVLKDAPQRKRHASADVTTPAKVLVYDLLLHEDVFPGAVPSLHIYNTTFDGVADVNDPARDIDRLDLCETIQLLGTGIPRFSNPEMPRYVELLTDICRRLGWDGSRFRGYRCRIEYPIFGTQVTMAFKPPPPPRAG
jgi:hypothetical protein